ncbi:MAG: hypothetical protein OXG58_09915 [Gemmatimonadetes bacterium]|nr:hypothetical protein [Gemmatimonadota bacterium]MCY3944255.1 hypothetical protein [Gemmatimonadota bacterium]
MGDVEYPQPGAVVRLVHPVAGHVEIVVAGAGLVDVLRDDDWVVQVANVPDQGARPLAPELVELVVGVEIRLPGVEPPLVQVPHIGVAP